MATATKQRRTTPQPTAQDTAYLVHVDPRTVLAHPGNLRSDLGDLTELKASIAANGVVQACTAVPDGDTLKLAAGHKRTAAAVEVIEEGSWPADRPQTVPYLVRPDLVGLPAEVVALMLVENDPDQRTALKPSERAAGYAQLAAFNLDADEIARRTGKTAKQVKATLRLNNMSETVREHADAGRVSLDDIAALEEFEDDPKAVARILKDAGSTWGLKHRMADERRKRTDAARLAELPAELAKDGITVVPKPKGWPYECAAARISDLRHRDTGEHVDPEQVKTLDGFAAFIDTQVSPPTAVLVCLDPASAGYIRRGHTYYKTPAQRAAEEEDRRAKVAQAAALADAQEIRERFITETYGNAKAAKALLVDALRRAVEDPESLTNGDADVVHALAGGDIRATAEAKQDRLSRLLVARWIASEEDNLERFAERGAVWRTRPDRVVAWLDRLTEAGYELSPAEAQVRADAAAHPRHHEDDDEQDDDQDQNDDQDQDYAAPFVLLYGQADGWVLLDDPTGEALATNADSEPAQHEQAHSWATSELAERGHTVTGWTCENPDEDDPATRVYRAELAPASEPGTDNDTGQQ